MIQIQTKQLFKKCLKYIKVSNFKQHSQYVMGKRQTAIKGTISNAE